MYEINVIHMSLEIKPFPI